MKLTRGQKNRNAEQRKCIKATVAELNRTGRARNEAAQGFGKTRVAYRVAMALKPEVTIFLAPSVSLVYQAMLEWYNLGLAAEPIAVVGALPSEDTVKQMAGLGYEVRNITNPKEIADAVNNRTGNVAIFSTYQSAHNLLKIEADHHVLDECHHLCGPKNKGWRRIFGKNVKWGTRHALSGNYKEVTNATRAVIVDMEDESVFGKCVYKLTIKQAVDKGILTPMEIDVMTIDPNKLATSDDLELALAGYRQAKKKFKLKRGVAFLSRVDKAHKFATIANKHDKTLNAHALSAADSQDVRQKAIEDVVNNGGIIANYGILGEGTDIPSLDHVVFVDPKNSIISATQNGTRHARVYNGKKRAHTVITVPTDMVIDGHRFNRTLKILTALLYADETITAQMLAANTHKTIARRVKVSGNKVLRKKIIQSLEKHIRANVIVLDGQVFKSVNAAARAYKVSFQTVQRWVEQNNGKSVATSSSGVAKPVKLNGKMFTSMAEAAKVLQVPITRVTAALVKNHTHVQTLQAPNGIPVVIDGVRYLSKGDAMRKLGIAPNTLERILKNNGKSVSIQTKYRDGQSIVINKKKYATIGEAAKALGISRATIFRLRNKQSNKAALVYRSKPSVVVNGKTYESVAAAAKAHKTTNNVVRRWINKYNGKSPNRRN